MPALLEQGGWVLGVILLLSTLAWFMIAWKWLQLRRETAEGFGWTRQVLDDIARGHGDEARAVCERHANLAGRLLLAAVQADEPQRSFFERRLRPAMDSETAQLNRHMDLIAVIAVLLPLLGLLGTVLGMVATFRAMVAPTLIQADVLAGGVSQALITTQAGLVAALPVMLAHRYLASRIRSFVHRTALLVKNVETLLCHP